MTFVLKEVHAYQLFDAFCMFDEQELKYIASWHVKRSWLQSFHSQLSLLACEEIMAAVIPFTTQLAGIEEIMAAVILFITQLAGIEEIMAAVIPFTTHSMTTSFGLTGRKESIS